MEKLVMRLDACRRAVNTLDEILQMPFTVIVRDASIQRFEYTVIDRQRKEEAA